MGTMRLFVELVTSEEGQATEYMMAIAVLVVAVVAATLIFQPNLTQGISDWGSGFEKAYAPDTDYLPKP